MELEITGDGPLGMEGGTIRMRVVVRNLTRNSVTVERIEMMVADSLGTFPLGCETLPAMVPVSLPLAMELVAGGFRPLRLSRRCIVRARFWSGSKCLGNFAQTFSNVWPAEYFGDEGETTARKPPAGLKRQASKGSMDRRHHGGGVRPS